MWAWIILIDNIINHVGKNHYVSITFYGQYTLGFPILSSSLNDSELNL